MRVFLLYTLLLPGACARPSDAIKIPPVETSFDVKGQLVKITAWGDIVNDPAGSRLALTADLHALQENISALLAAELNRNDRCGERLTVESATLEAASPSAILTGHMHVERWACAKAFGRDIAKRLAGGNAVVTVKLTPSAGLDGVAIVSEVQKIDAEGSLGELLRGSNLGDMVKQKIAAGIESSLRKALDLKSALPAPVTMKSARFDKSPEGRLLLSVTGVLRSASAAAQ